jgi:hypothetical protein
MRTMTAMMMLALVLSAAPGYAALGGDEASVGADQAQLKARVLRIVRAQNYDVHEIQASTGTVVREYVSSAGHVFAVAFQGPAVPNMKQLLGSYYDQYQRAAQARGVTHGPLIIKEPGLVVQISGRMRALTGRAYLPEAIPAGVTTEAIR